MTPIVDINRIQYCLKVLGSSFAQIGREVGVTRNTVRAVCARSTRSRSVEAAVSTVLGLTLFEVLPDWYDSKNQRINAELVKQMSYERRSKARAEVRKIFEQQIAA